MKWLWPMLFLFVALLVGGAWWEYYQWRDHSQDPVILAAANRYKVDPALVKAIVWRESWFRADARGEHGEIGLMQIRAVAAWEWARAERVAGFDPEHLLDPATNTLAGAAYLARVLRRYTQTDDPIPYALADYNAGRGNVLRWIKGAGSTNSAVFLAQMDFPGTRKYVETVIRRYEHYRPIFPKRD